MTPAEELRAAAEKLRTLTKTVDAPDLPDQSWHVEACSNEETGDCPCIVAQGRVSFGDGDSTAMFYVADAETPECAAYIAAMGPPVALALADWLDSAAIDAGQIGPDHRALAVARALLSGEPR
jgi:hypothetical protein